MKKEILDVKKGIEEVKILLFLEFIKQQQK
jgi:hypothetical protein